MWDVLSADFDTTIDGARCVDNMVRHVRPGSIVVLHDSLKAWDRLRIAPPRALGISPVRVTPSCRWEPPPAARKPDARP